MPGVFVTATGTDVGKTYVTAGLIRAGRRAGLAMDALKPILTGASDAEAETSDAGHLLAALEEPVTAATVARIAPWRFAAPLSPNMAAAAEGRMLDFDRVVAACRDALRSDRLTLIEGIGGVMVPIDERHTILDLIVALALPVVLVSGTQLGALSHCLTAAAVLRARHRSASLIVLDESPASTVPLEATRETVAAFCTECPVVALSRNATPSGFDDLLRQILVATARGQ